MTLESLPALCAALTLIAGAAAPARAAQVRGCAGGRTPVWSPSGEEIAWSGSSGSVICFARPDGTHVRALAAPSAFGAPYEMAWPSPNLLVGIVSFQIDSYAIEPEPHFLGLRHAFFGAAGVSFSLDRAADLLATGSADCNTCAGPVVLIRPGGKTTMLGGKRYKSEGPELSPDGRHVLFVRTAADDSNRNLGIWLASTDGGSLRRVRKTGFCPSWSPDGRRIAFADGRDDLFVESARGGRPTRVAAAAGCGVWSPNGKQIAFVGGASVLDIVDVHTRRVRTLAAFDLILSISWSPDSTQLLASAQPGVSPTACASVWRVPLDGTTSLVSACPG